MNRLRFELEPLTILQTNLRSFVQERVVSQIVPPGWNLQIDEVIKCRHGEFFGHAVVRRVSTTMGIECVADIQMLC